MHFSCRQCKVRPSNALSPIQETINALARREKRPTRDFDFIIGDWLVKHRRLNSRFTNCKEWTEFDGLSSTVKTLGGFGNLEDNVLYFPEASFRALALRSFCVKSGTWSIWWLDARNPTTLDVPVVGKFSNHIGVFLQMTYSMARQSKYALPALPHLGKIPAGI
ncbi:hypothetical protein BA896_019145 [Janthinobacterium lividum]|uniref:Uncharacterized protein n=1 Tax=Janthinobacterium lividum TaxID=29581 RepID=A0A1E8PKF6_9BURK|nr:hypothetical protein BA896_019145 [Janthinobacterium lividum]